MAETFTKKVKAEIEKHKGGRYKKLKSAFINNGMIYNPDTGHRISFSFKKVDEAKEIIDELLKIGILGSLSYNDERDKSIVNIYDANAIMNLLKYLGAIRTLNTYKKNVERKEKVKATMRLVNFETANIKRSADATLKQLSDIKKLLKKRKLKSLDADLQELIIARKKYPDITVSELAKKMGNVTKNALYHRFRKISELIGE